jgi:CubicO group peptidase (beta-lactamase class C family)
LAIAPAIIPKQSRKVVQGRKSTDACQQAAPIRWNFSSASFVLHLESACQRRSPYIKKEFEMMHKRFRSLVLASALLATALLASLSAASLPTAKPEEVGLSSERLGRIHQMIQRHIDAHDVTGAVTLVARRGKVVHFETHGLMDLETQKQMSKDAIFRLASSTKPVTATAILMLMEEGKLKLTDPVGKYIPEFSNSKVAVELPRPQGPMPDQASGDKPSYYTVPASRDITIVDLLTHTSGLASGGVTRAEFQALVKALKPTDTLADFIPKVGALPLDFQPGTRWNYSGEAGFDTLGRIVEVASGMTFDQFLRERLFEPLGMTSTYFNVPEKDRPRLATFYRKTPEGLVKQEGTIPPGGPAFFAGAGGLKSSVEDYFMFAQMLCNGGQLNGKRILSPWTVATMQSNHVGELFNGKNGEPPNGMGFGLGGEVIVSMVDSRMRRPDGSYGWGGAYGTYWWVSLKDQLVAIMFIQTSAWRDMQREFDNAVSQAVIE